MYWDPPLDEKRILIDILDRMCGLRLSVTRCHSGAHYIGRVFQKGYIGGKTTSIGSEKRVPIPSVPNRCPDTVLKRLLFEDIIRL